MDKMKKQISSLELSYIVKELQVLVNSRIDKIYHSSDKEFYLQFYIPSKGKKILKIIAGKFLYFAGAKEETQQPSGFCMFLRKHLTNARVKEIEQIKPERIVKFIFEKAGKKNILIIEFITKGIMVLCDESYTILNALEFVDFSNRSIKPKVKYEHPRMEYNLFKIKKENLEELFKKTKKESVVKALAVNLGLGGIYSEEICLLSKISKSKEPKKLAKKEIESILDSIKSITNKKLNPVIYYKNDEAADVVPFELQYYKDLEKKEYKNFNEALDYYYSKEFKEEKKPTKHDKEIEKIKRIIQEQETTIEKFKKSEKQNREKGELIYNNFQLIEEILREINKAAKKYPWKEIKEKLKGHKLIKDIDIVEKRLVVDLK